jgi:hypothetical protein
MILIKGDNSSLIRQNTKSYDLNKGRQLFINKTQYKNFDFNLLPIFYLNIQVSNYKIPLHKVNIWKGRCLENNFHT